MQKYVIHILVGCKKRESCRNLFKELKISPLASQYIPSLAICVINNKHQFTTNSEIHNKNKRQLNNLYPPRPNLPKYLNGMSYLGIKFYNNLPSYIKLTTKELQNQFQKLFTLTLLLFCRRIFFKTNLLEVLRFTQPATAVHQLLKLFKFHVYKHFFFVLLYIAI